jgi:hypothetical protein
MAKNAQLSNQGLTSGNIDLGYRGTSINTKSMHCTECQVTCRVCGVQKTQSNLFKPRDSSIPSELDYMCGSPLLSPSNSLYKSVMASRSNITCESPVDLAYYRSGLLCLYCWGEGDVKQELLQRFKGLWDRKYSVFLAVSNGNTSQFSWLGDFC